MLLDAENDTEWRNIIPRELANLRINLTSNVARVELERRADRPTSEAAVDDHATMRHQLSSSAIKPIVTTFLVCTVAFLALSTPSAVNWPLSRQFPFE